MNLVKEIWQKEDIKDFQNHLKSFSKGDEKAQWEKRILNTNMPCLAVPSPEVKQITKDIAKGNFLSFVDLWAWENWTNTAIIGGLICKIKDFKVLEKYLKIYANKVDNWASCDILKYEIKPNNDHLFFNLSKKFLKSDKPFVRRIGLGILFQLLNDDKYIDQILDIANEFYVEKEYYVNMMLAWLIAESFIKHRQKTLIFFKNHKLNKWTINKAISKCRDSYRVSKEDKEMLLNFKV